MLAGVNPLQSATISLHPNLVREATGSVRIVGHSDMDHSELSPKAIALLAGVFHPTRDSKAVADYE